MPNYNYNCKDCESNFSIFASMSDERNNVTCNSCESSNVYRVYSRIMTKSSGFSNSEVAPVTSSGKSGCGTCSSGSCGTCH